MPTILKELSLRAPSFSSLLLILFLVPRAVDEQMHGILPLNTPISEDSPLYRLTEGSAFIRSLFIEEPGPGRRRDSSPCKDFETCLRGSPYSAL